MADAFYTRAFINRKNHHSIAFVYARIHKAEKDARHHSGGHLDVGDCSRSISLSFDMYDPEEIRNSLHKIDKLHAAVSGFRTALKREAKKALAIHKKREAEDRRKKREGEDPDGLQVGGVTR